MGFDTILAAFGLTLLAGLSTGIGSALCLFTKRTNTKFLSVALGFSAGVMIYISFVELLAEAKYNFCGEIGVVYGSWATVGAFFGGILLIAVIDKLLPSFENPHEIHKVEEIRDRIQEKKSRKLFRMGVLTCFVIALHNFPEGFATFASALQDTKVGVAIAVAIAIHNIPEGIAISLPIYYATHNRKKAFAYSLLSGLAEPVGALVGYLFLLTFFNGIVMGVILAMVAGIMVFISLDQLLPAAREYGEHHLSIYGLIAGMAVISVSLLLFV